MGYSYTRKPKELPSITLSLCAQCNGSVQLTGSIPKALQSNIHAAMKNSKYDYKLFTDGSFTLHIKRNKDRTSVSTLMVIKECARRLGRRAEIAIHIKAT